VTIQDLSGRQDTGHAERGKDPCMDSYPLTTLYCITYIPGTNGSLLGFLISQFVDDLQLKTNNVVSQGNLHTAYENEDAFWETESYQTYKKSHSLKSNYELRVYGTYRNVYEYANPKTADQSSFLIKEHQRIKSYDKLSIKYPNFKEFIITVTEEDYEQITMNVIQKVDINWWHQQKTNPELAEYSTPQDLIKDKKQLTKILKNTALINKNRRELFCQQNINIPGKYSNRVYQIKFQDFFDKNRLFNKLSDIFYPQTTTIVAEQVYDEWLSKQILVTDYLV